MTREQIVRMARASGFERIVHRDAYSVTTTVAPIAELERFAELVAEAARKACVQIIEAYQVPVGNSAAGEMACKWTMDALRQIRDEILARGEA